MTEIESVPAPSRKKHLLMMLMALSLFLGSATMLRSHATALLTVREDALPLGAKVSELEKKLATIKEQISLSTQTQEKTRESLQEQVRAYVLPEEPNAPRALGVLETLLSTLKNDKHLFSASAITVGSTKEASIDPELKAIPIALTLELDAEGLRLFLTMLRAAGRVTISDQLTSGQSAALLRACTEGNPANIVSLEQFLSLDLLSYSQAPDAALGKFLGSVSASSCSDVTHATIRDSSLPEVSALYGSTFGAELRKANLWPVPAITTNSVEFMEKGEGKVAVTVKMEVLGR